MAEDIVPEAAVEVRRLELPSSMWSRTLSLRLMWPKQSTYVFGAGTVQKESKKGRKSYRGLGAEARVRSSLVELFEPKLRRVKLSQVESSRAVGF